MLVKEGLLQIYMKAMSYLERSSSSSSFAFISNTKIFNVFNLMNKENQKGLILP